MASASASLLKSSSPVLDKSEWVKGQAIRQSTVSVRSLPSGPSALTIRAGSYADELVKTAVCFNVLHHFTSLHAFK